MNSINSVGSSFGSSNSPSGRIGSPAKAIEKELTSYLQGQGLSEDKQASIKGDLQQAIQSTINSESRSDPGKLKSTIQGVLDKHGVNGKPSSTNFRNHLQESVSTTSVAHHKLTRSLSCWKS